MPGQDYGGEKEEARQVPAPGGPALEDSVDAGDEEEDREVEGGEVVVQVELAVHEEERKVVDRPAGIEGPGGNGVERRNSWWKLFVE